MSFQKRLFFWTTSIQMNPAADSIRQLLDAIRAALIPSSNEVESPHPWKEYLKNSYEEIRPFLKKNK